MSESEPNKTTCWQCSACGKRVEPGDGSDCIPSKVNPPNPFDRRATPFDAIAHGSEEHRAWLKKAIDDHFDGRPVERPHG